jgi:outer membrane protein assembly factor BamB
MTCRSHSKLVICFILFIIGNSYFYIRGENHNWPCWRGINQDGISGEMDWNPEALKNGAKILWRASVGQGHSNVSIKAGLLITQGSNFPVKKDESQIFEETVLCLDALTGKTYWQRSNIAEKIAHTGPRSTPTIDGQRVYTLGSNGILYCFDIQKGARIWKKDLVKEKLTGGAKWGFSTSPVIDDERLVLNVGRSGLVLNKYSGKVLWKSPGRSWGLSTPVLGNIGAKRIILLHTEHNLMAKDIKTGEIIWDFPWSYVDCDPVLWGTKIYLFGGKPKYKRARTIIELENGNLIKNWPHRKMNIAFQCSIFFKGLFYGMTFDKKEHSVQCFDPESGTVKWEEKLNDYAGFSIAGNHILLIESDGFLSIIKTGPDSFQVVSRAKIFEVKRIEKLPEDQPLKCWTSPVMCNGLIYLRNSYGEIACVDVRK